MIDQHYTPPWLAALMASHLPSNASSIADFCAGGGALLDAAAEWAPSAQMVATDIDAASLRRLRAARPSWLVGRIDLLSPSSRGRSRLYVHQKFDGVLLNPPFSYRGGAGVTVEDGNRRTRRLAPSIAFLDAALAAVRPGGTLIALLPMNALESERDRWWREQAGAPALDVVDAIEPRKFPGVAARMAVVKATGGSRICGAGKLGSRREPSLTSIDVQVVRGRVPVHTARQWDRVLEGAPFVHTTNLRAGGLDGARVGPVALASPGPMVLLPRVGRFYGSNIAEWPSVEPLVLSDCVFGLRPVGGVEVGELHKLLLKSAQLVAAAYRGSCAPYLTVNSLVAVLGRLGLGAVHVRA